MEYDCEKPDLKVKDQEEIAQLNQNLYLSCISDRDYANAMEYSKKCLSINAQIYGERSKKLPRFYYQIANSNLILQKKAESLEAIRKAIDIFDNPDEDKTVIQSDENANLV